MRVKKVQSVCETDGCSDMRIRVFVADPTGLRLNVFTVSDVCTILTWCQTSVQAVYAHSPIRYHVKTTHLHVTTEGY